MRYTDSHEWISLEGNVGTVGITEAAKNELGEIIHISLPEIGLKIQAGDEVSVLESTKAAIDIYAPMSGVVVEVNEELKRLPAILKEKNSWLFRLKVSTLSEYENLLEK